MKPDREPISTRGKVALVIVALVGAIYWLIGKIEVFFASIQVKQEQKNHTQ